MRVGLVCPYSIDVPGGVQAHVLGLADHLRSRGHLVSILAPTDHPHPPPGVVPAGRAVPVRYNGSVARLSFGPATRARVLRWLAEGPDGTGLDVVHLHEPMSPSCSALALWGARVPVVATFHTAITRSRAMAAAWPAFRPHLEKVGARIAVSDEALSTIERHLGRGAVVIPNGVRTRDFDVPPDPRWTGAPGAPTVAFLGRATEPRKGLGVLLGALPALVASHPGVRLVLAGAGGPQAVAGLPPALARHVETLGPVDDADRAALLASADVYVAPNTGGESFGIVLVEAMAAGAPVVASDLPAFRAVLGRDAGLGFRTGDPGDLARAVRELLDEPARRSALAAAGRDRARRFDWDTVGEQVLACYELALLAAHGDVTVGLRSATTPLPAGDGTA